MFKLTVLNRAKGLLCLELSFLALLLLLSLLFLLSPSITLVNVFSSDGVGQYFSEWGCRVYSAQIVTFSITVAFL